MMKRTLLAIAGLACLLNGIAIFAPEAAMAKPKVWTIYDRQVDLRKRVEKGAKDNELTFKEAKKLNSRLDEVAADVDKMKSKNDGKLSYKDEGKLEKRLNGISLDMDKCQLAKRVVAH
jgi:hypothetical protein